MPAMRRVPGVLVVLAVAAALSAGIGSSPAAPATAPGLDPPRTMLIVLENHEYDEIVGSPELPFLNGLIGRGALATRFYAITHPSLPNYLALLGGSTFGIEANCTDCWARGGNLARQLSRAGISWRAYMEGMPKPCYGGGSHGSYVKRHNPFMYFPSVALVAQRCRNVVPATRLAGDLRRGRLRTFSWITPNLCNDAHDCASSAADRWLSRWVPQISRRLGPRGVLIITFDEGPAGRGSPGGGRVMTLFAGPGARRGLRFAGRYDLYSLLATIDERYGLPPLRNARRAAVMREPFASG